ncbi:MAG TPA: RDD family protein [Burkholderiaceae bacterium]|nr:RDD family protein [Burkholderiaceae bacterium]
MTDEPERPIVALPAAGLPIRFASMIYEAVLLLGVAFVVSYAVLVTSQWSYPLLPIQRALLQSALFVAAGAYFVVCWTRGGQTLALKAWRLKVVGSKDRSLRPARAIARYVLSWHLWLPGLAVAGLFEPGAVSVAAALSLSLALLLIPPLVDHQRRLLHDLWTDTRLVCVRC